MNPLKRGVLSSSLLAAGVVAATLLPSGCARTGVTVDQAQTTVSRPVALVYRGPAACEGCAEAAANLLGRQPQHFNVQFIGPREKLRFSPKALTSAALYVQPGGNDDMDATWKTLLKDPGFSVGLIRHFVRSGGRYLGLCMGGYLAGSTDTGSGGFQILPGDSQEYVGSPGADVHNTNDTLVRVTWSVAGVASTPRMYFQDGPYFQLNGPGAAAVRVLARYRNSGADKRVAVMVAPYGRGRVGVSGPHPEATPDWYTGSGLPSQYAADEKLGDALISALMK